MVVRRVGILSLGKVLDVIYVVFRFLLGAGLTFFSSLPEASANAGAMFALFLVVGAIILLPLFYGVVGFVSGLVSASIYNGIVETTIGGLEIEVEEVPRPGSPLSS